MKCSKIDSKTVIFNDIDCILIPFDRFCLWIWILQRYFSFYKLSKHLKWFCNFSLISIVNWVSFVILVVVCVCVLLCICGLLRERDSFFFLLIFVSFDWSTGYKLWWMKEPHLDRYIFAFWRVEQFAGKQSS